MKYSSLLMLTLPFFLSCAVSNNPQRRETKLLQKGKITEDTSYVYALPYDQGTAHRMIQGYYSAFSHKNRAALDFKMKRGTQILAARSGTVLRLKEDGRKGGWNRKYRPEGNFVVIQHEDGTRAGYWHLQHQGVLVNIGDTVNQGQVIGLSGKTGYSMMPHLHFMVWSNKNGSWQQVPTRFQTRKGPRYLRNFRRYRNN